MIAFLEEEVDNRKPHFHLSPVGALLVSNDPLTTDQLSRSLQELASTEVCSEVRSAIRLLNTPVHQTHRARKHIADGRRAPVSSDEQRRLLEAFIAAAQKADMAGLEGLFAENVVSTSDGGGIVRAARVPVVGRERVAKSIATAAHFWKGVTLAWIEVNGQAAVLVSRDGVPAAVTTIDASAQGIDQIVWILRPSKLAAISKSRQELHDVMRQDRQPPRHAARPQTAADLKNRPLCLGFDHLGLVCRQPFPYRVR
jgi:hypothetical protein